MSLSVGRTKRIVLAVALLLVAALPKGIAQG